MKVSDLQYQLHPLANGDNIEDGAWRHPPLLNFTLIKNTQKIVFVCSWISLNLVADMPNVCTVEERRAGTLKI